MELLVPAYFYPSPGSDWDRLTSAARSGVPVTAIVNPASGPGTVANADYRRAIDALRGAGGRLLGYVPSGYLGQAVNAGSSCRPVSGNTYTPADIVACAARYQGYYTIDGIFVDEMGPPKGGAPEAKVVTFYAQVYNGVKAVNPAWVVVGNPGTAAPEGLLRTGTKGGADMLVTFENRAVHYARLPPAPYAAGYPAARFASILIEAGGHLDFGALLRLAASRNAGAIYVTDHRLPNPYDRLPVAWEALLAALRAHNGRLPPQ